MRPILVAKPLDNRDRRQAHRYVTTRNVSKLVRNCSDETCIVRNLSTHGAKADVCKTYRVNENVLLGLRHNEFVGARVAWVGNKSIGMEFYEPILHDAVLANLFNEEKRSGAPRVELTAAATIWVGNGCQDIVIGDLSQKGARILGRHKFNVGMPVCIELERIGSVPAKVRWSDATQAGVLFDGPLSLWDMMRCIKASSRCLIALPNAKSRVATAGDAADPGVSCGDPL